MIGESAEISDKRTPLTVDQMSTNLKIQNMKIKLIYLTGLLLFCLPSFAQTGVYVPQLAGFDDAMNNILSDYNIPGGQLAVTYQGRLVYNRGFGLANTAAQDSVYPNSIFRVASVSKPITSAACMKLYEDGLLNLDATVFGVDGILNDAQYQTFLDPRDTLITVRMLLQHLGGWNRDISGDPMFDAYNIATTMGVPSPPSPATVVQYMLNYKMLDFTPGTQSNYSNVGFCILGVVIEKISGQSYDDYVHNTILTPVGISDMQLGFNMPENQLPEEVNYYDYPGAPLTYSVYDNTTLVPWPYGGFNLEFMDGNGRWVASCQDLLKFVCAIDGFNTRPDILTPATLNIMTTPSVQDPNYACGINVNIYNNWWHLGSLPGTTSEFVRDGNAGINWAILFNSRDESGAFNSAMDNLVWTVLPTITEWPTFDLFDAANALEENKSALNLTLYPNPTHDNLTLALDKTLQKEITIEIYNTFGQTILKQTISNTTLLDCSQYANGIYFLRATDADQNTTVKKFIVEHK